MSVYHVLVINKAGSLIYDLDASPRLAELEKTLGFPLDLTLAPVDARPAVVFGERDGVRVGHSLVALNGRPLVGCRVALPAAAASTQQNGEGGELATAAGEEEPPLVEVDVFEYLSQPCNFPVSLKFGRPPLRTNEKIILSSMFHSLYAIGAQLSPAPRSSGIQAIDTEHFRLQCLQAVTGNKFVVVAAPQAAGLDQLLRRVYELYADFALKNPFYALDMPIRCELFDAALQALLDRFEKSPVV